MTSIISAGAPGGMRLGRGGDSFLPLQIPLPSDVSASSIICIGVGWRHNILILENGASYGWGNNEDDQLGISCKGTLEPTKIRAFEHLKLRWAHCGDKITAVLTCDGDVYVIGSIYGREPVKLNIGNVAIYTTCGVDVVYAIDCNGDAFMCSSSSGNGTLYHLPEPVCDIAAGGNFCLAVTTSGKAYAKGNDPACGCLKSGSNDSFIPIISLETIPILRVFGYCSHSVVLSKDGRVFVCGSNKNGRIGLQDEVGLNAFKQLHFFDNLHVCEVDCGDEHTVFITESGDVYGCGKNDDGRTFTGKNPIVKTPKKSLPINGKASFVRCGCFHSIILVEGRKTIHPGLHYFEPLVNNILKPKFVKITPELTIDVSLSSITGHGFITGDEVIISSKKEKGNILGILGNKICVKFGDTIDLFNKSDLMFSNRKDCVPMLMLSNSGLKIIVDSNQKLLLAFGFDKDDIIFNSTLGKGKIAGYLNGTIWFQFESLSDKICRFKDTSLKGIHSAIRIVETKRNIKYIKCSDSVEYPIISVDNEFEIYSINNYGSVIGEISSFYCIYDIFNKNYQLLPKRDCHVIQKYKNFNQFDVIETSKGECGTIIGCNSDNVLLITDENLLSNEQEVLFDNSPKLIYRLIGSGTILNHIQVGSSYFEKYFPGDIIATKQGFIRVVGILNNKILCCKNLNITSSLNEDELYELSAFDNCVLVSRRILPFKQRYKLFKGGSIELSINIDSFRGMKYFPGDEFTLFNENYIVFGCKDGYLWVQKGETPGLLFINPQPDFPMNESYLISRPTKHFYYFLNNV